MVDQGAWPVMWGASESPVSKHFIVGVREGEQPIVEGQGGWNGGLRVGSLGEGAGRTGRWTR